MGNVAPEKKSGIRWMLPSDMKQILPIESASYEFPWREDDFAEHIRDKNVIPLCILVDDVVIGYVVYENRAQSINILNLAVAHSCRLQGYGSELLDKLKSKLGKKTAIEVHVRESALDAHLFLKSEGFRAVEVCKSWFQDEVVGSKRESQHEDAYRFAFQIKTPEPAAI